MARRRGGLDPSEAFDLFLDTACNAFGGIIFISLLVCVLLQLSGVAAAPDDPQEVERVQRELTEIEQDIARLEEVRKQQIYQIGTLQPRYDPEIEALFARLADELRRRQADKRDAEAKRDTAKIDLAAVIELLRKLQRAEKDQRDTQQVLETALRNMPASPPPKGEPPRARTTKMNPVEVLVSGRRLIFAKLYDSRGNPPATTAPISPSRRK